MGTFGERRTADFSIADNMGQDEDEFIQNKKKIK
jgi:hypothetical protein